MFLNFLSFEALNAIMLNYLNFILRGWGRMPGDSAPVDEESEAEARGGGRRRRSKGRGRRRESGH